MSGLKLKLRAGERVLINGAVIQNGPRASSLFVVSEGAKVLRLRDASPPEQACTPVSRVAYLTQLVVSGDAEPEEIDKELRARLAELGKVLNGTPLEAQVRQASCLLGRGDHYRALRKLRSLISAERTLLHGTGGRKSVPQRCETGRPPWP